MNDAPNTAASPHADLPPADLSCTTKPRIEVYAYGPEECVHTEVCSASEAHAFVGKFPVCWINVDGVSDPVVLREFGQLFSLHELSVEDIINTRQRAKVEPYPNYLFVVIRMLLTPYRAETEQLSIFLSHDYVLSFQQCPGGDCFDFVRERLLSNGNIRKEKSDFLTYALIDAALDQYFPVLEFIGDRLEILEGEVVEVSGRTSVQHIQSVRRQLIDMRRAVWPLREAINTLLRDESDFVSPKTKIYLRDCHDHTVQILDLVEIYRELSSGLVEIYLSSISNRLNEVMKVLTIITTLFIPPTLIAGIYGMNFNTAGSPWNMPELDWYWGYPFALALMVLVSLCLLFYLKKRGWVGQPEKGIKETD